MIGRTIGHYRAELYFVIFDIKIFDVNRKEEDAGELHLSVSVCGTRRSSFNQCETRKS